MKRIIPYILILAVLAGIFSPVQDVRAQTEPLGTCTVVYNQPPPVFSDELPNKQTNEECSKFANSAAGISIIWTPEGGGSSTVTTTAQPTEDPTALEDALDTCGVILRGTLLGCVQKIIYIFFVSLPSFILGFVAKMFDAFIALTFSSYMYELEFIDKIWRIARDFANIFFILILLYAAFQIMLDLGHGGAKKIVASVILIALLVNFSLFFTKVIIDASNITALIFYNKVDVSKVTEEKSTTDSAIIKVQEKPMALALSSSFHVNRFFSPELIGNLGLKTENKLGVGGALISGVVGVTVGIVTVNPWIGAAAGGATAVTQTDAQLTKESILVVISMMVVYGLVIYALIYAFVVSAFSFLGRMLTLMMLMMLSPIAFVSASVPKLKGISTIGFDSWIKKLFESAFVGVIFMFIIYIISVMLGAEVFEKVANKNNNQLLSILVTLFVPALLIVILLLKGSKYARQASGQFTEGVINGAKVLGGLTLGGAALTTAFAGRAVVAGTAARWSKRPGATAMIQHKEDLAKWERAGRLGPAPVAPAAPTGFRDRIGARINRAQQESGDASHAQHEMEKLKKEIGVEGLPNRQLSGLDEARLKSEFIKSKNTEIERDIRNGYNSKHERIEITHDANGVALAAPVAGADAYKAVRRTDVGNSVASAPGARANGDVDSRNNLTAQGNKKVDDILNKEVNVIINRMAPEEGEKRFTHLKDESEEKVGIGTKVIARTTSGSYDPRNLANIRAGKEGTLGAKTAAGLIAAVAIGIRMGLKQGMGVSTGTPQRDFLKDIGSTISEALKGVKINVSGGHGGDSKKEDHGTSGGGHH